MQPIALDHGKNLPLSYEEKYLKDIPISVNHTKTESKVKPKKHMANNIKKKDNKCLNRNKL